MRLFDSTIFTVVFSLFPMIFAFNMQTTRQTSIALPRSLFMKKVSPSEFRREISKRKRIMNQYKEYQQSKRTDVPYFQMAFRPKEGGMWIPFTEFAGDSQATTMVNAYMSGFLTELYKSRIDEAIARSIFSQGQAKLKDMVNEVKSNYQNYPYRSVKFDDMVFGYKLEFKGLEEKMGKQDWTILEKPVEKNWAENVAATASLALSSITKGWFKNNDEAEKKEEPKK